MNLKKSSITSTVQAEAKKALSPVGRFLGHSMAAAIGFAGLAAISLIPIVVIHLIESWGDSGLAGSLHWLEVALVTVDIALFMAVFLAGAAVFSAEVYVEAKERIMSILDWRK